MSQPIISVEHLTKTLVTGEHEVKALDGVTFEVMPQEFFVIVGSSGSGKSTLLRCIAGLEQPDDGSICIDNQVFFSRQPNINLTPQERRVGMVFQSYAIWPHLSVIENVTLPLIKGPSRASQSEATNRAMQVLDRLGLSAVASRPSTALSGGQQQRVALARALAVSGKVVLMDEPLSNLDSGMRARLRHYLVLVATEFASTVIYVTHDPAEALSLGDRVAVIERGRLLQVGTPKEIYENPTSAHVAEALGQVNWLTGQADADGNLITDIGVLPYGKTVKPGMLKIGVRPRGIRPRKLDDTAGDTTGVVGVISGVEYQGSHMWVTLDVQGFKVTCQGAVEDQLLAGMKCELVVDPGSIICIAPDTASPVTGNV